jgi:cellulose synthase (UDP-forming)
MRAVDPREVPADWAPPEATAADRLRLRLLISVSVAAALWYFAWLLQPARVGNPVLYGLLLLAELFNVLQAVGFWWTCSRRTHRRHCPPPQVGWSVDLLIPVYNEPVEIVEPVIRACLRLRSVAVRVVVLDDGKSDQLRALTSRLGADYLRRPTNRGAKAGNINAALARTSAPFVAVLDCDHVPDVRFLEATVGHFADERVAFVQTPQFYANARQKAVAAAAWSQQALFFGGISVGKDALGAMFCCGTNVVFRRAALDEVGGFPEDSITEDFQMSVSFHSRGWRSVYVPEVLARGLGPEDMASYVSQQLRWARGCISAIPSVLRARLPIQLRLQYLLSASYFLYGWTVLIYMFMPVARIVFDAQPVASTSSAIFLWHFAPYFLLCMAAVARAGGGSYTFSAFALAAANFWIGIISTLRAVLRRPASFVVTPKSGAGEWQPQVVVPSLIAVGVLLAVSAWGVTVNPTPGVLNAAAFAVVHSAVLLRGAAPALNLAQRRRPVRVRRSGTPTGAQEAVTGTAVAFPVVPARAEQPSTVALLEGTT